MISILLTVQNLTIAFGERILFQNASFLLDKGEKISLIGRNGTGKTTFLKALLGQQDYEGGIFFSHDAKIGSIDQIRITSENTIYDELLTVFSEVIGLEKELANVSDLIEKQGATDELIDRQHRLTEAFEKLDGYSYRSRAKGALIGLGFSPDEFSRKTDTLSGGENTRLHLAKLLLSDYDLLLLDEPTNHLDMQSVEWLESFLKNTKSAVLVVSHDRYFLDRVTTKTMEIAHQKLTVFSGGYTVFQEKKKQANENALREYEQAQKEEKHLLEVMQTLRSHRDFHGLASKEKALQRLRETMVVPDSMERSLSFSIDKNEESGDDVLTIKALKKAFDDKLLFENVEMLIKKGERAFLLGGNGTGKTTLLKLIVHEDLPDHGSIVHGAHVNIGYYEQSQSSLDPKKTPFSTIADAFPRKTETEVRTALGTFLFRGEDVFKPIEELSGGERARILLLKLLLKKPNLLILDEPTNHLDIESKEALENALLSYNGTILAVSHDRYFIQKLATTIYNLDDCTVSVFRGSYDYYLEKKTAVNATQKTSEKPKTGGEDYRAQKALEAEKRKKENQRKKNEQRAEEIFARLDEIAELLSDPAIAADYVKAEELMSESNQLEQELETLLVDM